MDLQSLVMGFGGTGSHILTALKQIAVIKQGGPRGLEFLEIDTESELKPKEYLAGGEETIDPFLLQPNQEYFYLKDGDPELEDILEGDLISSRSVLEHLENWLHRERLLKLDDDRWNVTDGAAAQRQIGRYAISQNATKLRDKIANKLEKLSSDGAGTVPVWIIGSAAGGTGAGTMIDAAFLTRAAAKRPGAPKVRLAGVVVLPSVYSDRDQIEDARVHSFFRELERFQMDTDDTFKDPVTENEVASRAEYAGVEAHASSSLFNYLFYVGRTCNDDQERTPFFTSVANAIEPYLDAAAGNNLISQVINDNVVFSSFGASRLYVPQETLAKRFAQEQVRSYLRTIVPPTEGEEIQGVETGGGSRKDDAEKRVKNTATLFKILLERHEGATEEQRENTLRDNLSPETIVLDWLEFKERAEDNEDLPRARLTYLNPFWSLAQPQEDLDPADIQLQTYNENRDADGVKEPQSESRDRFHRRLGTIKERYTEDEDRERRFERGKKRVVEVITRYLQEEINENLAASIEGDVDVDDNNPGTPLTRLYEELKHVISKGSGGEGEEGILQRIERVVYKDEKSFLGILKSQKSDKERVFAQARRSLDQARPGLLARWSFGLVTWVEAPQKGARKDASEYVRWYQMRGLFRALKKVLKAVRERYEAWHDVIEGIVNAVELGNDPARVSVDKEISLLDNRLQELTKQETATINLDGDPEMQGYQDELRGVAVESRDAGGTELHAEEVGQSRWGVSYGRDGAPVLKLEVNGDTFKTFRSDDEVDASAFKEDKEGNLVDTLKKSFRGRIDERLESRDVFDYLLHLQNQVGLQPEDIAVRLTEMAEPLFPNKDGATINRYLVREMPDKNNKANLERAIRNAVPGGCSPLSHTDQNAISVVQSLAPPNASPGELEGYKDAYERTITQGRDETDAQAYHPFRPELEAWFVERHFQRNTRGEAYFHLPPRIVRLLKHPEMMQAFVQCLASDAVERTEVERGKKAWVWYEDPEKEGYKLTEPGKGNQELIYAATTFVLRQQPLPPFNVDIDVGTALESAKLKAEEDDEGPPLKDQVQTFTEEKAQKFVEDYASTASKEEKKGLVLVFQFYGQWGASHSLDTRMLSAMA